MINIEVWYQPNGVCIFDSEIKEDEKEEIIDVIFNNSALRVKYKDGQEIVLGSNIVKNSIFKFTTVKE
jgi:hypothetical protein